MADTALLFKYGYFTKEKWQAGDSAETVNHLVDVAHNNRLLWLINFYQVFQGPIRNRFEKLDIEGLPEIEGFVNGVQQYYQKGKSKKLLICEYGWNDIYGNYLGHSVVITGAPEYIGDKFKSEHNHEFDEYGYRIPVYDPNRQEETYLYVKSDFSMITNGNENSIISLQTTYGDMSANAVINLIAAYSINENRVLNIETIADNGEIANLNDNWVYNGEGFSGSAYIQNKSTANMRITNGDGKYVVIDGMKKVDGNLECTVSPILKENVDGNSTATNSFITLNGGEWYSVESEGESEGLDSQVMLKNSYMTVQTEGKAKANFRDADGVELENMAGKAYSVKITVNKENSVLPYNSVILSGTDAKELKVNLTNDGVLVTGDNLKNLKVVAKNARATESKELNVGTDAGFMLIKVDENGKDLLVYADKDGDGNFETLLSVKDKNGKSVGNAQTGDGIEQALIGLFGAFMVLIFMEFVKCVRIK